MSNEHGNERPVTWDDLPPEWRPLESTLQQLFDPEYYAAQLDRTAVADDLLLDYLAQGYRELLNPHPLFDTHHYLAHSPDLVEQQLPPLVHFVVHGAAEGRSFHPLFDVALYRRNAGKSLKPGDNMLRHYLARGAGEGFDTSEFFDREYYVTTHADLHLRVEDALVHFLTRGFRYQRNPHPAFDMAYYLSEHPELDPLKDNALAHFVTAGDGMRDKPNADFDLQYYVRTNPDVAAAGVCPVRHYMGFGFYEGRPASPIISAEIAAASESLGLAPTETTANAKLDHVPLLIIGMHRSGTSLIAQLLRKLGYSFGAANAQLPTDAFNERGYHELTAVASLNNTLLRTQSGDWDDTLPFDAAEVGPRVQRDAQLRLAGIIADQLPGARIAIKDPRFSLTLPAYGPLLGDAKVILVHRSPAAVARSLNARDNTPLTLGTALWEHYNLHALANLEGRANLVLSYESVLQDADAALAALTEFLELDAADVSTDAIVAPKLNHADDAERPCYSAAGELWEHLKTGDVKSPLPPLSTVARDTLRLQHMVTTHRNQANALRANLGGRDWLDRRLQRLRRELVEDLRHSEE